MRGVKELLEGGIADAVPGVYTVNVAHQEENTGGAPVDLDLC